MKIKTRNIFTIGRNHIMSNNLRTVTPFKLQPTQIIPQSVQTTTFERDLNKQLIALESERQQSMGRTYVNMLPAR